MGVRPVGVSIGALSKFFPQQEIEAILRASGREGKRRRKLPALDLMYYLIALGLHASEGFLRAGTLRSVGFKFGRWVDSVIMQRPLGAGDSTRP